MADSEVLDPLIKQGSEEIRLVKKQQGNRLLCYRVAVIVLLLGILGLLVAGMI